MPPTCRGDRWQLGVNYGRPHAVTLTPGCDACTLVSRARDQRLGNRFDEAERAGA